MKQLTITFLFSIISIFCFAQTPFTEKTFLDFAKKMEKDPVQTLENSAVTDFVFVGTGGFVTDLKGLIALYDNFTSVSFTPTDYKIRTYGNSTIVTGRLKHTYTVKKTGAPRILDELITYTYAWINGEWKFTSAQHSDAPIDRNIEEVAIKKILDDVDAAFNGGDKDGVINAWKNDPKISFIGSGAGGEFNLVAQDFEGLKKAVTQYVVKPTGTKGIKSNHRFMFKGNLAIVEFDQEDIRANGTKGHSHSIDIFEKVGDSWKVIVASHHGFNNKNEDTPEEIVKQWIADYNKDGKSFFENNCSDDYIASNTGINGGKFFDRATIIGRARKENETNDAETTNMKSFKSGNLAVVMGNLIWHHKQPDGSDKPEQTVSTFILQKKDGKWWYAGHHISPLKE